MENEMKNKILIIDDEKNIRNLLRDNFGKLGYTVLMAENPQKARALAEKNREELLMVVQDCNLGEDDLQLIKDIKNITAADVVVYTGGSQNYSSIQLLEAGATDVVNKTSPKRLEEIAAEVKTKISKEPVQRTPLEEEVRQYRFNRLSNLHSLVDSHNILIVDENLESRVRSIIKDRKPATDAEQKREYSAAILKILEQTAREQYGTRSCQPGKEFNEKKSGVSCRNYIEAAHALIKMDDETFSSYVNPYKNDFAFWVGTSVRDAETAKKISLARSKEEAADILLGIPLAFTLKDKSMDLGFFEYEPIAPTINTQDSTQLHKQEKLNHYSFAVVSQAEFERVMKYINKNRDENKNITQSKAMYSVNDILYTKHDSKSFLNEMMSFLHTIDEANPGEKITIKGLKALLSLANKSEGLDNLIKYGKFRYEIQMLVTDEVVIKIGDKLDEQLKNEVRAMEYYRKLGVKCTQVEGCLNIDERTVSLFTTVPGERLDKFLFEVNKKQTPESRALKSDILNEFVKQMAIIHTNPPDEKEVNIEKTHLTYEMNCREYTREILKKFVGFTMPQPSGLGLLIQDASYIARLRKEFMENLDPAVHNVSGSIYLPVTKVISSAKPGMYADMSPFNCYVNNRDITMIDFESLRNSPYTFDLATAFEMRKLISNKRDEIVDADLYLGDNAAYKKGESISEKEKLLLQYAKHFNEECAKKPNLSPITDYQQFLTEYYAAAVQRALVHCGTFTRLIRTQSEKRTPEYRVSAVECLENAAESAGILNRRLDDGSADRLCHKLEEIRSKIS